MGSAAVLFVIGFVAGLILKDEMFGRRHSVPAPTPRVDELVNQVQQTVLDAQIKARLEERDRFRNEREMLGAALKIFDLIHYNPSTDQFIVSPFDVAMHRLSKYFPRK